ncbi:MAG: hypothetical protein JST01_09495 [Cyanobacteria bacterium SZAS TMP-1]|nr:hypothetical protein [Cyanobacteria bacterium SZAS TMP-1]
MPSSNHKPKNLLSLSKENLVRTVALLTLGGVCNAWSVPAMAAVSAGELVSAVEKAKILATGTRVSAAINGSEAYVSTFKNARATDNDCKIEAVLIAKTAMDLAPNDITRATVYFYSTANINKRKYVTVTAGDVKAFGSGQLGQEQLLSSLTVKDEEVSDPAAKLSSYLQQRETLRSKRSFTTSMSGQTMTVAAEIDAGTSERDLKYEAFKIAEKALEAGGSQANKVVVSFADPVSRGTVQQISFETSQLKSIDSSIQSALNAIQISAIASRIDVQALSTADGDEKESRDKLLASIKGLDKQGVGVTPFLKPFFDIEAMAAGDNNPQLKPAITRLSTAIAEQEARSKSAKDFKPTGAASTKAEAKPPEGGDEPVSTKKTKSSRWVSGSSAMTDGEILTDVDKAIDAQANTMGGVAAAEKNQKFAMVLYHAYEVLQANNRTADAQRIMRRYTDLKAKNRW